MAEGNSSVIFAGRAEENTAQGHGGGFATLTTASLTLGSGAIFSQNSAVGSGGCAYFGGGDVSVGKWRPFLHVSWNCSTEFDPARSVCLLAESDASFERCQAGLDGGAIYTSVSITFGIPGRPASTTIKSNSAGGSGGGVMAFSSAAALRVESGYSVVLEGNQASVDGGGFAFEQGASLALVPEVCDPSMCVPSDIGNGVCNAPCLHRACNW